MSSCLFQLFFLIFTIGTLTALSYDRCSAITDPLNRYSVTHSVNSGCIVIILWILSAITASPDLIYSKLLRAVDSAGYKLSICSLDYSLQFWIPGIVYLIALVCISYSYIKLAAHVSPSRTVHIIGNPRQSQLIQARRIRVAKLVLLLVFLFFVCATPTLLYDVFLTFKPDTFNKNLRWIFSDMQFLHSTVNPTAIFVLSGAYRKALSDTFTFARAFRWGELKRRYIDRRSSQDYEMMNIAMRTPRRPIKINDDGVVKRQPKLAENLQNEFSEGGQGFRFLRRSLTWGADQRKLDVAMSSRLCRDCGAANLDVTRYGSFERRHSEGQIDTPYKQRISYSSQSTTKTVVFDFRNDSQT